MGAQLWPIHENPNSSVRCSTAAAWCLPSLPPPANHAVPVHAHLTQNDQPTLMFSQWMARMCGMCAWCVCSSACSNIAKSVSSTAGADDVQRTCLNIACVPISGHEQPMYRQQPDAEPPLPHSCACAGLCKASCSSLPTNAPDVMHAANQA